MVFLLPSLCSPGTSSCTSWHSPQAEPEGEQRYQGVAETLVDSHNIVMGMGSETRTHSLSRPASLTLGNRNVSIGSLSDDAKA